MAVYYLSFSSSALPAILIHLDFVQVFLSVEKHCIVFYFQTLESKKNPRAALFRRMKFTLCPVHMPTWQQCRRNFLSIMPCLWPNKDLYGTISRGPEEWLSVCFFPPERHCALYESFSQCEWCRVRRALHFLNVWVCLCGPAGEKEEKRKNKMLYLI